MLNKKYNNYFSIIKPLFFIFTAISFLAPLTSNASMRDKWYQQAVDAEAQCGITHEKSPDYKSEEWQYYNGKRPIFNSVESYYKRLRKETVGSIEGLIEDKLCSEGRMKNDFFGRGGDYLTSPNVCYLGGQRSVEVFVGVADTLRGYDPDKLVEDATPLCVKFYTEKYFAPTFERLRNEKK